MLNALLECEAARRVWKLTEFYEDVKMMAHQDMLSVLQEIAMKRKKGRYGTDSCNLPGYMALKESSHLQKQA